MLGLHHCNYVNDVNMINEIRVCTKEEFRNCNFSYIFHLIFHIFFMYFFLWQIGLSLFSSVYENQGELLS